MISGGAARIATLLSSVTTGRSCGSIGHFFSWAQNCPLLETQGRLVCSHSPSPLSTDITSPMLSLNAGLHCHIFLVFTDRSSRWMLN